MRATTGIAVAVVLLGALAAGRSLQRARGELESQREAIGAAWTLVDEALRRRAELMPHVRQAARALGEEGTAGVVALNEVRELLLAARSPEESMAASVRFEPALGRVMEALQNLPASNENEDLMRLREDLANSENEVAVERRKYNDAVQKYNTSIELFPSNIAASLFGFTRHDAYFQTEPAQRNEPRAQF